MNKISRTLRKAMRDSDTSLYQLARDAGLAYSRVHELANGVSNPRLSTVEALCEQLNLELRPVRWKGRR